MLDLIEVHIPGFNIPFNDTCSDVSFSNNVYDGPSHTLETARAHRYALEILEPAGNKSEGILLYLAKCTRPSPEIDVITIHSAQDEIYRPGKNRWKPLEFTFYEVLNETSSDTAPDSSKTVYQIFKWWSKDVLDINNSRISSTLTANAQLDMLNGIGDSVWTYEIFRCWPDKVTPSDLDYSNSDICRISVNLRYDKAIERKRV